MGRSKYDISINTQPSNAIVHVQDGQGIVIASGVTPVTFELKSSAGFFKRARYRLQFFKEGYEEVQYPLVASLDGNYFLNLFSWGALGMLLVDPATGAMWRFDGDSYLVTLTPKKGNHRDPNNSTNVNQNNINIIIKKSDLE